MKPAQSLFLILFGGAALVNLWSEMTSSQLGIYLSKPLLMTFLGLFFISATGLKTIFSRQILAGLAFSLAGDTLLMFNAPGREQFFLFGLGAFLVAHLCYIFAFLGFRKEVSGAFRGQPFLALPFFAFLAGFLAYLWPGIPADLKIPVAVYSTVIIAMSMSCFNLRPKIEARTFFLLFTGVVFFIISDSLIALSKFQSSEWMHSQMRLFIMITYLVAQYLIASRAVAIEPRQT